MNNYIRYIRIHENPFLLFSPFLLLYIVFVLFLQTEPLWGDEGNYTMLAKNLIHGFYSPPFPNVDIHDGPGYPILLMPYIALKLPMVLIKLMNPIFQYLSVILIFKSLRIITPYKIALLFSLFWACYFNSFDFMPRIYPETFTSFLVTLVIFLLMKAYSQKKSEIIIKYICLSGFTIGYIALTKIIFGYVILVMLFGSIMLWLLNRKSVNHRISLSIMFVALLTISPYLFYTYQLTGKYFYLGTTGGNNLYWMSSPHKQEYGDWFTDQKNKSNFSSNPRNIAGSRIAGKLDLKNRNNYIPGVGDSIKAHHHKDLQEIYKNKGIDQDDAYKRIAIANIKAKPAKFIQNCISNTGRILFNYPYSYTMQKPGTLIRFPLNMTILVFAFISTILTFINWQRIIFPIRFMLLFSIVYLGGSILGSAEIRMFTITVPMLLFWIAYILSKSIKLNLRFDENSE
jgi:hypothetical protein